MNLAELSQAGLFATFFALVSAVVSIGAAVVAARTGGLRFRWLWVIGCLVGFGWSQTGLYSGAFYHGIGINFPAFGAKFYGSEWWVRVSIPLIAFVFLGVRGTGRLGPNLKARA